MTIPKIILKNIRIFALTKELQMEIYQILMKLDFV